MGSYYNLYSIFNSFGVYEMNYQLKLDEILNSLKGGETLLLHACCAPCSSYVLEYLSQYFSITVLFYNPNIDEYEEYYKRAEELKRLVSTVHYKNKVSVIIEKHNPEVFYETVKGFENEREGGARCFLCYRLRLEEACKYAKANNFDYFTTTLSISPYKNSNKLNEIGKSLEEEYGIKYLYADFKKRNGYKRSIELSKKYSLYRQNFCGCKFSKRMVQYCLPKEETI